MKRPSPLQRQPWFQQRLRDDSGVVAVIVALSMSTFLLGFAALAVDAGSAFATKAELQSLANRLAVDAASALPDPGDATTAFQQGFTMACQDKGKDLWGKDRGPCKDSASFAWATDGDRGNGEIEFFDPVDTDHPLDFGHLPAVPRPATPAHPTAVRVSLPPSTVEFGFGAAIGFDSTDIQKFATARIGSSLGAGILPFAATETDLSNGQFCVVDPDVPPATATGSTYPGNSGFSTPRLRIDDPNPASVAYDPDATDPTKVTLTLVLRNVFNATQQLKVHYATSTGTIDVPTTTQVLSTEGILAFQFTVPIPRQDPGVNLQLWVTGRQKTPLSTRWRNFTSDPVQLNYQGRPASDADPCSLPQASGRGFVDLARQSGADTLEDNIRWGPQVQLYPQTLLDPVKNIVGDLCVQKIFQPMTSCVSTNSTPGFNQQLSSGLFTSKDGVDARLKGDCGNGTTSSGGNGGVDASKLIGAGASTGLLDTRTGLGFGDGSTLRAALVSGAAAPARDAAGDGWISGQALRCPRMAVLPVISSKSSPLDVVLSGGKEITGFVYLWIDGIDASRGLNWNGGRLRSVSGYVIDPKYLPAVVAGSGVVGPYLGTTMPKEATLICDLGTRGDPTATPPVPDRCTDGD